ncbi:hypothetical protein [Hymenobacter sp. B81]|uniref:hypothetical protein n=1 Tax=Hymenobacter sp. B81 TaxID=3344878 RepID=UPI0037DCD3FA
MKTPTALLPRLWLASACLGLGLTLPAQAQSPLRPQPVTVDQVAESTYLVRVSNPRQQRGEVRVVRMRDNATLFSRQTTSHTFGNRLNMRELPDGQYAFVVKVGKDTHNYLLDIHTTVQRTTRLGSVSMATLTPQ